MVKNEWHLKLNDRDSMAFQHKNSSVIIQFLMVGENIQINQLGRKVDIHPMRLVEVLDETHFEVMNAGK